MRWLIAPAPLAFLLFVFLVIRRKWPVVVIVISGILFGIPTWVALLLLAMSSHRSQYAAPLVSAIVVSAVSSSLMLVFSDRLKSRFSYRENAAGRIPSRPFRYPLSAGVFLALAASFGLGATQFNPNARLKAVVALGITALAISLACFFYEKSNREQVPK